jgi:hypothetical protein
MTKAEMIHYIEVVQSKPSKYPTRIEFKNKTAIIGHFLIFDDYELLRDSNKWRFVINGHLTEFNHNNQSKEQSIVIDGYQVFALNSSGDQVSPGL